MIKDLQSIFKALGESGCLCICYCLAKDISYTQLVERYEDLVSEGIITADCYVNNPVKLYNFFGSKYQIIKTTKDEHELDEVYIAEYSYNGKTHFVLMKNGKLFYNPLKFSNCVANGQITSYRFIR